MKYFGTDGIRGVVDIDINSQLAYKVGLAIGRKIIEKNMEKKVIIGKDTRLSNDVIAYSISCGLMDMGIDCIMIGVVPTACVSFLTSKLNVSYGVMVTASHNSWEMNGIKVINEYGYKCSKDEEEELERNMEMPYSCNTIKGKIISGKKYVNQYIDFLNQTISVNLAGYNIALDMANGSNYQLAPEIFKKLGANIVTIGFDNDGRNINENCGAQHIERLKEEVLLHKCDIGFAFDGDADRLRVVLKDGTILNGDDIIYIFANFLKSQNKLNSMTVVGTIMTNTGLQLALEKLGIKLIRVDVGDKNVIDKMVAGHYLLGGEPSGHIALLDYNTTCDALFNALYLLKIIIVDQININDYLSHLNKFPSTEVNLSVSQEFRNKYNIDPNFSSSIEEIVNQYKDLAKIIIRPSGTEPVFRIMIESISEDKNINISNSIITQLSELDAKLATN